MLLVSGIILWISRLIVITNSQCSDYLNCVDCLNTDYDEYLYIICEWNLDGNYCFNYWDEIENKHPNTAISSDECPSDTTITVIIVISLSVIILCCITIGGTIFYWMRNREKTSSETCVQQKITPSDVQQEGGTNNSKPDIQISVTETPQKWSCINKYDQTLTEILYQNGKLPKSVSDILITSIPLNERSIYQYFQFNPFSYAKGYGLFEFLLLLFNVCSHFIIIFYMITGVILETDNYKCICFGVCILIELTFLLFWYGNGYYQNQNGKWIASNSKCEIKQYYKDIIDVFYNKLYFVINLVYFPMIIILLFFYETHWILHLLFFVPYLMVICYHAFIKYKQEYNSEIIVYKVSFYCLLIPSLLILLYCMVYNNMIYFTIFSIISYVPLTIICKEYDENHISLISIIFHILQNAVFVAFSLQLLHNDDTDLAITGIIWSIFHLLTILALFSVIRHKIPTEFQIEDCEISRSIMQIFIYTPMWILLMYYMFNESSHYIAAFFICITIWIIRAIWCCVGFLMMCSLLYCF